MHEYRLYFCDAEGHITGAAKVITALDEDNAIAEAKANSTGSSYYNELWHGIRLVAKWQREIK